MEKLTNATHEALNLQKFNRKIPRIKTYKDLEYGRCDISIDGWVCGLIQFHPLKLKADVRNMTEFLFHDINTIKNTFGAAVFFDSVKKQIEFCYIKDILSDNNTLNLDNCILNEELHIENMEDSEYAYSLTPVFNENFDKTKIIDAVEKKQNLPFPWRYFGKISM